MSGPRALLLGCAVLLGAACGGAPDETVEVVATDFRFDPASITVDAGTVRFDVPNRGADEHELEIFRGKRLVGEVEDIAPGLTRSLTVSLEPGDYTFVCKVADHEQRGMTGTLTVR